MLRPAGSARIRSACSHDSAQLLCQRLVLAGLANIAAKRSYPAGSAQGGKIGAVHPAPGRVLQNAVVFPAHRAKQSLHHVNGEYSVRAQLWTLPCRVFTVQHGRSS